MLRKMIVACAVFAVLGLVAAGPAAAQGVLFVNNGNVGIGQENPDAPLVVEADGGGSLVDMVKLINNGSPQFRYINTANGVTWRLGPNPSGDFVFNEVADLGLAEMRVTTDGQVFVNGGGPLNVPDYVFADDYELMSINELEQFIADNGHLPNVPNAEEVKKTGLNLTKMPLHILEKVEELTLYTIEQHSSIEQLQTENALLRERLAALETAIAQQ